MKRITLLILVLSLLTSCGRQSGESESVPAAESRPASVKPAQTDPSPAKKTKVSIQAEVLSFDGTALTLDNNGEKLTFTHEDNIQFFRNYYGLLCDPLKKGHVLYITYDAGSGRIEDIAPLPENASYYDPVGGAQGHIVSLSRGGVTFKLLNGEEVTAPVAPKLADFKALGSSHINKEYIFDGFEYRDGDILITEIMPLIAENDGRKNFGTDENAMIERYTAAQVLEDNGQTLHIKRNNDSKEFDILPFYSFPDGRFQAGDHILFSPLDDTSGYEGDIPESTPCTVAKTDGISGSCTFLSDYQGSLNIWGETDIDTVRLHSAALIDTKGQAIPAEALSDYKNARFELAAKDILYASHIWQKPEYYTESVTLYEK